MPLKSLPNELTPALASATRARRGFTLLEILSAISLLAIIMLVTASVLDGTSRVVSDANSKIEAFQSARAAFYSATTKLSQATLNTYWDYFDSGFHPYRSLAPSAAANFVPASYGRYSDLHFVCGQASDLIPSLPSDITAISTQAVFFASPTGLTADTNFSGMQGLLASCGYFVAFGSDQATRPNFLTRPASWRWRLMEISAPAETLSVFDSASGNSWFTTPIKENKLRSVAENVIALVVWPRLSSLDDSNGTQISGDYSYDSRTTAAWTGAPPKQPVQASQLPPNLQVTMVVIDEANSKRLENGSTPPSVITDALLGLFQDDVTQYDHELQTLEGRLAVRGIKYRTFSSSISLKEAKWSP